MASETRVLSPNRALHLFVVVNKSACKRLSERDSHAFRADDLCRYHVPLLPQSTGIGCRRARIAADAEKRALVEYGSPRTMT